MNKRKERLDNNGGKFTENEFHTLKLAFDNRCVKCGDGQLLEADHIIPVSLGGNSNISNIQPLCKKCNFEKLNRESIDYRKSFFAIFEMDMRIPLIARINFLYSLFYPQQSNDILLREIIFGWKLTKEQIVFADNMISGFTWGCYGKENMD